MDIETLTTAEFEKMPLVAQGESKEVRYSGNGLVVIRLKPTVYSYTHNRSGILPGSETLRLQAIQTLLPVLEEASVDHTYQKVNDRWILSDLVLQPKPPNGPTPFRPDDLSENEIAGLPIAPPIEVIAKQRHTGTSKHRYYGFGNFPLRAEYASHGSYVGSEKPYPHNIIRFDWRNPLNDMEGKRLADEILPEDTANWFIDTAHARSTAQLAFDSLAKFFESRGLDLWDICFFITEDGKKLFGEVSPDCMRVRALGDVALDKDVWRAGGSSSEVLQKWQQLVETIRQPAKAVCYSTPMRTIHFVTGNDNKFREAKALLPILKMVNIDLPEEQSLDPQAVVRIKLEVAKKQQTGPLIVEDTSLYLNGLNGFPGPLIKWMMRSVGNQGIYELCQDIRNRQAIAKTVIGYDDGAGNLQFFDGEVSGQIVAPYGNEGFGWDNIFQPDGLNETFAEMGDEYKPKFSMRTQAFRKLKEYLAD